MKLISILFSTTMIMTREVMGISRKGVTGVSSVVKGTCINPATEDEILNKRLGYGDKVRVKVSAYADKEDGSMEYSPDIAESDMLIGRANIPVLNEHLEGMCEGEVRRVMTWLHPKTQAGPLAYLVELVKIVGKSYLQRYGAEKALQMDEDGEDESEFDDLDNKSGASYPTLTNVKIPKGGVQKGDTAHLEFRDKTPEEKGELQGDRYDEL